MTVIRRCPVCKRPRQAEFVPFCSSRCRDRDLLRWLSDGYALPSTSDDPPSVPVDDETG